MPLSMEVGLSPDDFVLDGDPASPPLKGHSPQFLSNVRCGQTTGWMKTTRGTEVDLFTGHIVLDGVPALRERAQQPPSFRPMCSVSVKRRHSVFDAQNFGQNAQKRKTVRQVTQRIFR